MKVLLIFLIAICGVFGAMERFDGHKVYRVYANTEEQKNLMANLQKSLDLDFWSDINNVGLPVDVMVKPDDQHMFLRLLLKYGIQPSVYIENVQTLIDNEKIGSYAKGSSRISWTQYYNLNEINAWLDDVAAANPDKASIVIGGRSHENRDLKGIKISFGAGKKSVFIEGGIHAREWVSPATITYLINEILTSTDPAFRRMAESFEWHIFPVVNPDGFTFTHTNNRMWRKTRAPHGLCFGADPNRNWDAHWMEQGSSSDPCSDTFAGPRAFSEIETSTLSEYISSMASTMAVYISFHSYSQLLLLPYGHTTQPLDNYNEMMQIGAKTAEALAVKYGTQYRVGNIAEIIYPASGGTIDWVKQEFQTPVVLAYELRDTGRFGFLLPADQIIPNSIEVMDSLIGMMDEAEKFGYVTLG